MVLRAAIPPVWRSISFPLLIMLGLKKKKTFLTKFFAGNVIVELYTKARSDDSQEFVLVFLRKKDFKWEQYCEFDYGDLPAIRDLIRKVDDFVRE